MATEMELVTLKIEMDSLIWGHIYKIQLESNLTWSLIYDFVGQFRLISNKNIFVFYFIKWYFFNKKYI